MGSVGRFKYERCVTGRCACHDNPPPQPARGVALTLAMYADSADGAIPARYSPSLTALSRASGFARSTTASALAELEKAGWLERKAPPPALARSQKITTAYRLTVPASPHDGLVREADQSDGSPGDGLVRDTVPASPGAGHNQAFQTREGVARSANATTARSETCPRHPNGNPTNELCQDCGRIRRLKEQQAARAKAERSAEQERRRTAQILEERAAAKAAAVPRPDDTRILIRPKGGAT